VQRHPRITTKRWELQVKCHDDTGLATWVPVKELKVSSPVEFAAYVVAERFVEGSAFAWWVRNIFRKRNRRTKRVKA
jgi:hypothetical protein